MFKSSVIISIQLVYNHLYIDLILSDDQKLSRLTFCIQSICSKLLFYQSLLNSIHYVLLSSSDLAQCGSTFELFDKDRDGKCTRRELGLLMRACNQTPSEVELDAIYTKYNLEDDNDSFDLSTFTKIMEAEYKPKSSNEVTELRDQFRVFDRNDDGTIGVSEFRYIMTNLGEKMSDDEINELLADPTLIDAKTGLIQYEKLIKIILG